MSKWTKHIIFLCILVILCLPLIQQKTGFLRVGALHKAAPPAPWERLSTGTWVDGSFQSATEEALEQRIGFRPWLIRIKNQIEYSLFRKANARGVIVGKRGYLFEEDYLRAYTGGDYPGDWYWKEKFRRASMVKDTLSKLGVELAVIIEPSKASYYSEYIPDKYHPDTSHTAMNYQSLVNGCMEEGIEILDLYSHFNELKDAAEYPLFPKGGIHWSYYGMLQAMDVVMPVVERITGKMLPEIITGPLVPEYKLQGTDADLAQLMNLVFDPVHPSLPYPELSYTSVPDSMKPRVLAISDSFYFNILNAGIPANSFANTAFWYYNVEIYPDTWSSPKDTTMINYREEVESMDLIMVMITERFFYKFAWQFFDRLYDIYYPDAEVDYRYDYTARIISHYKWFDEVIEESANMGISLQEGLDRHAAFQFWQDDQKGLLKKTRSYYEMKIRGNDDWMKQMREKAERNGISIDEQIRLDAEWTLKNQDK